VPNYPEPEPEPSTAPADLDHEDLDRADLDPGAPPEQVRTNVPPLWDLLSY
jgi:hypothetical protein